MVSNTSSNNTSPPHLYIGLMSGTSMDGIDAALVDFSGSNPEIVATLELDLEPGCKDQLLKLCAQPEYHSLKNTLHISLGEQFASACNQLLQQAGLQPENICAIGSHGQTVLHVPPENGKFGYSVQIGDSKIIANTTGIQVISDFRNADMRLGGQGAPLAPAFHEAVFGDTTSDRAIVNIGGMANLTLLPARGETTGFDTGPGNVLMDSWASQHLNQPFDINGDWAARGHCNIPLLEQMLEDPYFSLPPPKSTGREYFNTEWLDRFLDLQSDSGTTMANEDIQFTLSELTVLSITKALLEHAPSTSELYVCGGGAFNTHLLQRLDQNLDGISVYTTAELGVEPQWVEAACFAWLAKQHMEEQTGNLPSVTGASKKVILGELVKPG
jgi:anhydro-N-acetylmuramic acid kinase